MRINCICHSNNRIVKNLKVIIGNFVDISEENSEAYFTYMRYALLI